MSRFLWFTVYMYMHWHQTAARTSQTWIILQPASNSHASL